MASENSGEPSSEVSETAQWDFSIITGILLACITLYFAQCVRLYFMPLETRNKLTMIIWWSILLNLVALQFQYTVLISISEAERSINELTCYALDSFACFFFTNAVMLQVFEWDLLGSLIKH